MKKNIIKILFTILLLSGLFVILTKTNLITFFEDKKVEAIMVNQTEIGLKLYSSFQLKAYTYPVDAHNSHIKWLSSDSKIVSVNENTGYIIGEGLGSCYITALNTNTNLSVDILVHVSKNDIAIDDANFIEDEINLLVNNAHNLNYTVKPSNANCHNIKIISSDNSVLEVSDYSIKALRKGSAIVSIIDSKGKVLDTIKVNIYNEESEINYGDKEVVIKDLLLSTNNVNLVKGGNIKIKTNVIPSNAIQKVNYYVVDNNICSIENNIIYGKNNGSTKIIVSTINGISKIINVNVSNEKIKVTEINSPKEIRVNLGTEKEIDTKVLPSNATNQNLSYYSSDENVVKVTENGLLLPQRLGSAIVTVISTDGGFRNLINVYVTDYEEIIYETDIKLSSDNYYVNLGETLSLNPIIYPSNASNKNYTLKSLNEDIVIIEHGLIKGVKEGIARVKITTKNSNISKIFKVTVNKVKVENITISKNNITLLKGTTSYIDYYVYPENATNKIVEWIINDKSICTIDNGIIYGNKKGKTIVKAKIDNVIKEIIVEVID